MPVKPPLRPFEHKVLQLKIVLLDTKPMVWRRVQVEATVSLAELHRIIQKVMPWQSVHQHQFTIGGECFGLPETGDEGDEEDEIAVPDEYDVADERRIPLFALIRKTPQQFTYVYDFGDEWRHMIKVEKAFDPDPDVAYPVCTAGRMACPPDDSGSTWGYYAKLEVMKHPEHPDYEDTCEWMGHNWDPDRFDPVAANQDLATLQETQPEEPDDEDSDVQFELN
jgi:hypothetical protein